MVGSVVFSVIMTRAAAATPSRHRFGRQLLTEGRRRGKHAVPLTFMPHTGGAETVVVERGNIWTLDFVRGSICVDAHPLLGLLVFRSGCNFWFVPWRFCLLENWQSIYACFVMRSLDFFVEVLTLWKSDSMFVLIEGYFFACRCVNLCLPVIRNRREPKWRKLLAPFGKGRQGQFDPTIADTVTHTFSLYFSPSPHQYDSLSFPLTLALGSIPTTLIFWNITTVTYYINT